MLSEAIVASVPILASRIAGTVGILGEGYPGYFAVGNTRELSRLMKRAETELAFLMELTDWCKGLAPQFSPLREKGHGPIYCADCKRMKQGDNFMICSIPGLSSSAI